MPRWPATKRDHSVQIDPRELGLQSLHSGEIVQLDLDPIETLSQPTHDLVDDRPRLAVPITYMSGAELEQISRFPR